MLKRVDRCPLESYNELDAEKGSLQFFIINTKMLEFGEMLHLLYLSRAGLLELFLRRHRGFFATSSLLLRKKIVYIPN